MGKHWVSRLVNEPRHFTAACRKPHLVKYAACIVEKEITREQIAKAQRLSTDWKAVSER